MGPAERTPAELKAALARYRDTADHMPQDGTLWIAIGDLEAKLDRPEAAAAAYREAAERFAAAGEPVRAVAASKRLLTVEPDTAALGRLDAPLFAELGPAAVAAMLRALDHLRVDAGEAVVREGDPGDSFYVLVAGSARVIKAGPDDRPVELAELGPGNFFGEFAFLTGQPRTASVVAAEPCELLVFPRDAMDALTRDHPEIRRTLADFQAQRVVDTVLRISPVFQPLEEADRRRVLDRFVAVDVPKGETLIRQGEHGEGFYVVVTGTVDVHVKDVGGHDSPVAQLSTGDFFGEISLITGQPTNASCTTATDCRLYRLDAPRMRELLAAHPEVRDVVEEQARRRVMRTKLRAQRIDALNRSGML